VDQSIEKRSRSDHKGPATKSTAILEFQTNDLPGVGQNSSRPTHQPGDAAVSRQFPRKPLRILMLISLGARRPHRGPAAPVEQLELDAGRVDRSPHESPERIDLAHQVALSGASDGGIAGHVRDGIYGERAQPHLATGLRGCPRRFGSGVASADYNNIEIMHCLYVINN
jgi:hypothetical protein